MKKLTTRSLLFVSLLLISILAACGGSSDPDIDKSTVSNAVQEAANTFVTDFNNRDLTRFDALFAPPGDQYGTTETLDAAHQLMASAADGVTFQMDKFEIQNVQLDDKHVEAVVTYYAEVSMWENQSETYSAVVTQDVSLQKINDQWLITGGDTANVTPGMGAQDS